MRPARRCRQLAIAGRMGRRQRAQRSGLWAAGDVAQVHGLRPAVPALRAAVRAAPIGAPGATAVARAHGSPHATGGHAERAARQAGKAGGMANGERKAAGKESRAARGEGRDPRRQRHTHSKLTINENYLHLQSQCGGETTSRVGVAPCRAGGADASDADTGRNPAKGGRHASSRGTRWRRGSVQRRAHAGLPIRPARWRLVRRVDGPDPAAPTTGAPSAGATRARPAHRAAATSPAAQVCRCPRSGGRCIGRRPPHRCRRSTAGPPLACRRRPSARRL